MSNGVPNPQIGQSDQFSIFHTFSTVRPGCMPKFMNALAWQAAWLWHFFDWERVVVGYALTDIPERVLEVYGIPNANLEDAKRVLKHLHEQPEYGELNDCRDKEQRELVEELLPAMGYETYLTQILSNRQEQRDLLLQAFSGDGNTEGLESRLAPDALQRIRDLQREIESIAIPDYFLRATIKVKVKPNSDSLGEFAHGMEELAKRFKRLEWEFIAAGRHLPKSAPDADPRPLADNEVMHLWKFGDANDLYEQMVVLRENQLFAKLEEFTDRKPIHLLMCDWEALSKTKRLHRLL